MGYSTQTKPWPPREIKTGQLVFTPENARRVKCGAILLLVREAFEKPFVEEYATDERLSHWERSPWQSLYDYVPWPGSGFAGGP